jgi:chloramphenicol 3-O phosphotransferase
MPVRRTDETLEPAEAEQQARTVFCVAGRVIILNGTASAGKSTLAAAIQDAAAGVWVLFAQDDFARNLLPRWVSVDGGPESELGERGFHFVRSDLGLHVEVGDVGRQLLRGYRQAVGACARTGCDVVVDECAFDPDASTDWVAALSGLEVSWVRVECDLAVCEEREARRADRSELRGLARGQYERVHARVDYDVVVDLTDGRADREAIRVLEAVARR